MEAVTAAIAKQQTGIPPRRRASTRRQTLPGAPRLRVVRRLRLCLESGVVKGGRW